MSNVHQTKPRSRHWYFYQGTIYTLHTYVYTVVHTCACVNANTCMCNVHIVSFPVYIHPWLPLTSRRPLRTVSLHFRSSKRRILEAAFCLAGTCSAGVGRPLFGSYTDRATKLLYCVMFLFMISVQGPRTRSNRPRLSLAHLRALLATTVATRGRSSIKAISPK